MSGAARAEAALLSLSFSAAELTRLQEASGQRGVEEWARAVILDLVDDLVDAQPTAAGEAAQPPTETMPPVLAVNETALLLEEMRALRDELKHSLAEQRLWLHVLYAELRTRAPYPTPADENAACTRAGEQLARMKRLVADKLHG